MNFRNYEHNTPLYITGLVTYMSGFILWNLDQHFCGNIQYVSIPMLTIFSNDINFMMPNFRHIPGIHLIILLYKSPVVCEKLEHFIFFRLIRQEYLGVFAPKTQDMSYMIYQSWTLKGIETIQKTTI